MSNWVCHMLPLKNKKQIKQHAISFPRSVSTFTVQAIFLFIGNLKIYFKNWLKINLNIVPWILYKYFLWCFDIFQNWHIWRHAQFSYLRAYYLFFSVFTFVFFWLVIEKFQINEDRQFTNYIMYFTRNFNRILNPKYYIFRNVNQFRKHN